MGLLGIKACLAEGYPPLGGISLPESTLSESCQHSGLIQLPNKNESILGGHAILFVGYDDSKELLTFKNSWGASWGNKGYGYLPYTFASAGLIKDVWTIRQEEM
jgi:C1A family cysteine protease